MLEQIVEVVTLHDHVVELKEAQPLLHALLIALGPKHVVDREAGANLPQQLHIVQIQQPVGVVDHLSLAGTELDEFLHLLAEALGVMVDVRAGQHLAHVAASGRVADHGGAAADQGDGLVAGHLQSLHQRQRHKMARCQAVGCAVKADIKRGLAGVDHVADLFLVGHLGDETPGYQFFIDSHLSFVPFLVLFGGQRAKQTPPAAWTEGDQSRGTTSYSPPPHGTRPHGVPTHPRAVTGAPDTLLLTSRRSEGCSGMYSPTGPLPLPAKRGLSWQAAKSVTSSLRRSNKYQIIFVIIVGILRNVNGFSRINSKNSGRIPPPAAVPLRRRA